MRKITATSLSGLSKDKNGKREFNRSAYRYSGIGAVAFIFSLGVVFVKGFELTAVQWLACFTTAMVGGIGEYIYLSSAKLKKPKCTTCGTTYEKYLNADRPDDTEYVFVCEKCSKYYKVLHSTKADF